MKNNFDAVTSLEYKSCAALTIQCLADSGVTDRKTAFEQQIANAKKLGLMPDDFKVIRETLQDFGFVMQSTAVEGVRVSTVLSSLGYFSVPAVVLLQLSDYQHPGGNMIAVQIDSEKAIPIVSSTCPRDFDKRWVTHVWIRWSDGIDRSPYPRRSVNRTSKTSPRKREFSETAYYKPFQPNPRNNYIGDCVVRAISGAMDITWSKAIDLLSTMREVTVNAREVYPRVLEKHGFVHHNPLMKNGRRLDGKAFCEEMNRAYHNEERIFAHVGRSHVAAIVLVPLDDRRRSYKIIDSWDSSDRLIGEYWVLAKKSSKTNLVASTPVGEEGQRQTDVGSKLHHPTFGDGIVIQTASGVLTIDFGDNGTRRLGEDWVIKNCSVVVENAGQAEIKVAHNKR